MNQSAVIFSNCTQRLDALVILLFFVLFFVLCCNFCKPQSWAFIQVYKHKACMNNEATDQIPFFTKLPSAVSVLIMSAEYCPCGTENVLYPMHVLEGPGWVGLLVLVLS
jgi:hypothetical protein